MMARTAEPSEIRIGVPPLVHVDPVQLDRVGGEYEVEATRLLARLLHDSHTLVQARVARLGIDVDRSGHDDHDFLP